MQYEVKAFIDALRAAQHTAEVQTLHGSACRVTTSAPLRTICELLKQQPTLRAVPQRGEKGSTVFDIFLKKI